MRSDTDLRELSGPWKGIALPWHHRWSSSAADHRFEQPDKES